MVQILRFCGSLVSLKYYLLLIIRVICALCLSLILILSEFFRSLGFPAFVCVFMRCVTLHVRIANRVGEDSRSRGGIVNTRFGCSSALLERRPRPKALWWFRVSTSNSPSSRSWPPTDTHLRDIDHTYAQQDIRVCGDDHFQPPTWQLKNPRSQIPCRFCFFA